MAKAHDRALRVGAQGGGASFKKGVASLRAAARRKARGGCARRVESALARLTLSVDTEQKVLAGWRAAFTKRHPGFWSTQYAFLVIDMSDARRSVLEHEEVLVRAQQEAALVAKKRSKVFLNALRLRKKALIRLQSDDGVGEFKALIEKSAADLVNDLDPSWQGACMRWFSAVNLVHKHDPSWEGACIRCFSALMLDLAQMFTVARPCPCVD